MTEHRRQLIKVTSQMTTRERRPELPTFKNAEKRNERQEMSKGICKWHKRRNSKADSLATTRKCSKSDRKLSEGIAIEWRKSVKERKFLTYNTNNCCWLRLAFQRAAFIFTQHRMYVCTRIWVVLCAQLMQYKNFYVLHFFELYMCIIC